MTTVQVASAADDIRSPRPFTLHRFLRLAGPAALVAGSILAAGGMALHVPGAPEDEALTRTVAEHSSQWLASHLLSGFGLALLAAGTATVVRLARGRGARLTAIGAVVTSSGAALMSLGDVAHGSVAFALAEQVDPARSLEIQKAFFGDPAIAVLSGAGMLLPLGILILGAAVLRSRVAPRWVGAMLLLSPIAVQAALLAHGLAHYLLVLPFVVAMSGLARALVPRTTQQAPMP